MSAYGGFMSSGFPGLPPGCTDADIDRAAGSEEPDQNACDYCGGSGGVHDGDSAGPCPKCKGDGRDHSVGEPKPMEQAGRAGRGEVSKTPPARFESSAPRYVIRVFDRSGTCELNETGACSDFGVALECARRLAVRYHQREYFAITLQNDTRVDENFDGLTDEEREQFHEAIDTPRPAANPDTDIQVAATGPGASPAAGPGRIGSPRRNLSEYPALKDIDDRIRGLEAARPALTDADRQLWSIYDDIRTQVRGLLRVLDHASRRRP